MTKQHIPSSQDEGALQYVQKKDSRDREIVCTQQRIDKLVNDFKIYLKHPLIDVAKKGDRRGAVAVPVLDKSAEHVDLTMWRTKSSARGLLLLSLRAE